MRLALATAALLLAVGPGRAATDSGARVDRAYSNGSYIHVLASVSNRSGGEVDMKVTCSAFDKNGGALGVANAYADHLGAGETTAVEVLMSQPPGADTSNMTAVCRAYSH